MTRRCIVQIYMDREQFSNPNGNKHYKKMQTSPNEFVKMSSFLAKKYAEKVDADYYLLTDNPVININHPVNERLQLFMPMWTEKYDQILYLDSDVFCWPEAPDLFEICPPNTFAKTEKNLKDETSIRKIRQYFDIIIEDKNTRGVSEDEFVIGHEDNQPLSLLRLKKYCYFNGGVFMAGGKEVGDEMMKYMNHRILDKASSEALLNFMVAASKVDVFGFPKLFNGSGEKDYFYHAMGGGSDKAKKHGRIYEKASKLVEKWRE